jgi:hypothetical protein
MRTEEYARVANVKKRDRVRDIWIGKYYPLELRFYLIQHDLF